MESMGIVNGFFVHNFTSKRKNALTDGNQNMVTVYTNQPCLFTKKEDKSNNITDGAYGMERLLYCSDSVDIQIGDIITDNCSGTIYSVRGEDANIPDMVENTDGFSVYVVIKANQ